MRNRLRRTKRYSVGNATLQSNTSKSFIQMSALLETIQVQTTVLEARV